jgi:CheY-like chemotaxis protein
VAKILVADDNSNIQKMVGIALKDQGIDVVAVGNGEAAVRKIADVRPDLVLADVFMPVRNGYEVCRYVKADSSLAHIPVILLVGAFDPLDEQEAQRVGADGVLKKPFVPPDPLISMVKSALVRASSGQVATLMEKPASGPPATDTAPHVPTVTAAPTKPEPARPEPFVEDIPERPQSVKIDSSNTPLAFGKLLETAPATAEEDLTFVTPSTQLPDRDWGGHPEEEEDEEEEEDSSESWRRDGGNEAFANEVEKTASKAEAPPQRKKRELWTPTREKKQDLIEVEENPIITAPVRPPAPPPPAAPQVSGPVASSTPSSWMNAPVPEQKKPDAPVVTQQSIAATPAVPETVPETKEPSAAGGWFSVNSSPWEAEAQKASQLAATWDGSPAATTASPNDGAAAPVVSNATPETTTEPVVTESSDGYEFVSEEPSSEPVFYAPDPALVRNEVLVNQTTLPELISDGAISPETVETIRQTTSYALEDAAKQAIQMSAAANKPAEPEPQPQIQAPPAAPDMEALVAKVLAKLSPEMIQAVTRELLKPIVETLVRDELKPNK